MQDVSRAERERLTPILSLSLMSAGLGCRPSPRSSTQTRRLSPSDLLNSVETRQPYLRLLRQLPWQLGQTIPAGSHSTKTGARSLSLSLSVSCASHSFTGAEEKVPFTAALGSDFRFPHQGGIEYVSLQYLTYDQF